jgi:hypothetical protein
MMALAWPVLGLVAANALKDRCRASTSPLAANIARRMASRRLMRDRCFSKSE